MTARSKGAVSLGLLVGLLALAAAPAGAVEAGELRIAVAPFGGDPERGPQDDPEMPLPPGLGDALAARLEARSVGQVVEPERVWHRPKPAPEADTVRRWAEDLEVDSVVVGRHEWSGPALRVEAELRSGHSGSALSRYRVRTEGPEAMSEAADRLAADILGDLGVEPPPPPVDVAAAAVASGSESADGGAAEPAESAEADEGGEEGGGPFGMGGSRRREPIQIQSDELEMVEDAGGRRIVFSQNVVATQDDITLKTDELEAYYPPGQSQPEKLVASGHVRVRQGDRRARCDRATYRREEQTIVCEGRAELSEQCDRVRGEKIRFELDTERVRVVGAPSVVIYPDGSDESEGADGGDGCSGDLS